MSKEKEKMRLVTFNRGNGENRGVRFTNYRNKEVEFNIHRFDTEEYWSVGPEVTLNTEDHMVCFSLGLFWWNVRIGFEWRWLRDHFNKLTRQTRETGLTVSKYRAGLKLFHVDNSWMDVSHWLKSKGWNTQHAKKGWMQLLHKYIVKGWSFSYHWDKLTAREYTTVDSLSGMFRIGNVDGIFNTLERDYPDIELKWTITELKGEYEHWLTKRIKSNNEERLFGLHVDALDESLGKYKAIFPATRGKGENSWDCDDDIFIPNISFGVEDPETFIDSVKIGYIRAGYSPHDAEAISIIKEIPLAAAEHMVLNKTGRHFWECVHLRGRANDYMVTIEDGNIMDTKELSNEDTCGSH